MATETVVICDRCGKTRAIDREVRTVALGWQRWEAVGAEKIANRAGFHEEQGRGMWDLCGPCATTVRKYIEMNA
jgi:hypothetical protein